MNTKALLKTLSLGIISVLACVLVYYALVRDTHLSEKWARQASALRQIGIILYQFGDSNNGRKPQDIHELKAWASQQDHLSGVDHLPFWNFVNPETGETLPWEIRSPSDSPYWIVAPISRSVKIDGQWKKVRLVLSKVAAGSIVYEYITE